MKRVLFFLVTIISFGLLFSGCGGAKLSPEVKKSFDNQETLYTKMNMHYNVTKRGAKIVEATNYQVGILIPVNSEVKMKTINAKQIVFEYKGQDIILRNIPKYTGIGIDELAKRYFSKTKVDLSKFTKDEQKAIRLAQVVKNMSKDAVVVSLGVPPSHTTPTLEMPQWKYWQTRWKTFLINFDQNGKTINSYPQQ